MPVHHIVFGRNENMTNPVVFKHTLSVGLLTLAQAIVLPLLATVLLVFYRWYFGAHVRSDPSSSCSCSCWSGGRSCCNPSAG